MMQAGTRVLGIPGRVIVTVGVSLWLAAGLAGPLGPVAYAKAGRTGGGTGAVEETKAEPTTLALTLQGEGGTPSGANIVVPAKTAVSAAASLEGTNAGTARGSITYRLYSDSSCTWEVAWAGPKPVRQGLGSPALKLAPGTYYWQAAYSGDSKNAPSVSACGAVAETVEGDPPASVSPCTSAAGEAHLETEGGHVSVTNDLSTNLASKQKLVASWSGRHRLRLTKLLGAACVAGRTASHLHGVGEARMDGQPGYIVRFNIRVDKNGAETVRIHVRNARHEPVLDIVGSPTPGSEVIA
jgi:hypothetical protein